MKPGEKQLLNEWILQQSEFSKNDLLVTIDPAKVIGYSETLPLAALSKTLSVSQNSIKESGINPFCKTRGIISWEWNNQQVQTPVWIIPCEFKIDKVRELVYLSPQEENGFLNPFLIKKTAETYDVRLTETHFETVIDELKKAGFKSVTTDDSVVGNFHHHRYILLKELQELADSGDYSSGLKQFLSGEKTSGDPLQLPEEALLPYDTDHRDVFELFSRENCVVQGPPGTGKSQLLTNIIGKLLLSEQSIAFVSEKRAALEVIRKRLSFCNLEQLSIVATDDLSARDFILELKKTWEFFDDFISSESTGFSTRREQENNLQFTLDLLNQPELVGGISFSAFKELLKSIPEGKNMSDGGFHFLPHPPLLDDYRKTLPLVEKIYTEELSVSCSSVAFSVLQKGNLAQFATNIAQTKDTVGQLEKMRPGVSQNELEELLHQSAVYQLFQNELAKKYAAVIEPGSKAQKQFLKLHTQYRLLNRKLEHISECRNEWKLIPSELELKHLLQVSRKSSFFQKLRFKKRWSQLSHLPAKDAEQSIGQLQKQQSYEKELFQIEEKLMKLGVDLYEADTLKAGLHLFSEEKWNLYNGLSTEHRKLLSEISPTIHFLKEDLRTHYRLHKNRSISRQLETLLLQWPQLIVFEKELSRLNQQISDAMFVSTTFEEYRCAVLRTHQTIFRSHYPTLSNFSPEYLKEKVEALIEAEKKEHLSAASKIRMQSKVKFEAYNQLLNTPAVKLTEEQKAFKQQLKKGKSILVKEFSKSRQHPTLRELMQSEANWWIRLLKPVWLTNPAQLAKTFPLQKALFDTCIMDEASQIPVHHGVGALQRCQRIIIAGDEQQMNPVSYFQAGSKEVTSVLQHAGFYFPKTTLTHHYRSKHAPLIAFSNRWFYDNKLVVYPSFPVDPHCINRHFCTDGKYIDRTNNKEAVLVAEVIANRLKSDKTIGVVAFSQEQANAILKAIPPELSEETDRRIEQNTLFIKPLEKVQGDECEHLIISLGYAPDENGQFHLRFGPLNTGSGRNRLNVLFSRASETIDFVCSIESSALKWSENESVQLLHKWLQNLEQQHHERPVSFPLGLHPEIDENQLLFKAIYASLPNALELLTAYSVLKKRGWKLLI